MDLRVLNIYLGDMKDAIYHPPTYFDNQYEDEWLTDKTAIQMIRDVDHSEVISARLIDSPVLGPRQLCSVAFTVRRTERRVVDIKIGSCHRW